jgi:hypothetical protein
MWGMQNLAKIFSKINRPRGKRERHKKFTKRLEAEKNKKIATHPHTATQLFLCVRHTHFLVGCDSRPTALVTHLSATGGSLTTAGGIVRRTRFRRTPAPAAVIAAVVVVAPIAAAAVATIITTAVTTAPRTAHRHFGSWRRLFHVDLVVADFLAADAKDVLQDLLSLEGDEAEVLSRAALFVVGRFDFGDGAEIGGEIVSDGVFGELGGHAAHEYFTRLGFGLLHI